MTKLEQYREQHIGQCKNLRDVQMETEDALARQDIASAREWVDSARIYDKKIKRLQKSIDKVREEIREAVEEIVIDEEGKVLDLAQEEFEKDSMTRVWLGNREDQVEMDARLDDHLEHFAPATA